MHLVVEILFSLSAFVNFSYDDIFEESMAKFYVAEMVLAIHALHNMGFVHRSVLAIIQFTFEHNYKLLSY